MGLRHHAVAHSVAAVGPRMILPRAVIRYNSSKSNSGESWWLTEELLKPRYHHHVTTMALIAAPVALALSPSVMNCKYKSAENR